MKGKQDNRANTGFEKREVPTKEVQKGARKGEKKKRQGGKQRVEKDKKFPLARRKL